MQVMNIPLPPPPAPATTAAAASSCSSSSSSSDDGGAKRCRDQDPPSSSAASSVVARVRYAKKPKSAMAAMVGRSEPCTHVVDKEKRDSMERTMTSIAGTIVHGRCLFESVENVFIMSHICGQEGRIKCMNEPMLCTTVCKHHDIVNQLVHLGVVRPISALSIDSCECKNLRFVGMNMSLSAQRIVRFIQFAYMDNMDDFRFDRFPNIGEIVIRRCGSLTKLFASALASTRHLTALTIDHCAQPVTLDWIGSLVHLQSLTIRGQTVQIPKSIGMLQYLSSLELAIAPFPEKRERMKNYALPFSRCACAKKGGTVPETIGHLQQLKTLSVVGCCICSLPPQIGYLKNLTRLETSMQFPVHIAHLSRLEKLEIPMITAPCHITKDVYHAFAMTKVSSTQAAGPRLNLSFASTRIKIASSELRARYKKMEILCCTHPNIRGADVMPYASSYFDPHVYVLIAQYVIPYSHESFRKFERNAFDDAKNRTPNRKRERDFV